ncbi:DUF7508 domain-containing protein [Halomicrobium salinisoli]|uniref:DUF7508 domain-containing protein n=1 Tax=Halomicrobium salinisoli TaxID=2878391 RepID=UPI001CF03E8C|nr:GIY-YIG nuclease family protein [Halomicrobium salinisoli]
MPISKPFSKATVSNVKEKVPQSKGIYELRCFGEVVYVGSSKNLQERLLTHLSERQPNSFRFKTLGWFSNRRKAERKHYDRHAEKYGSPPAWNDQRP